MSTSASQAQKYKRLVALSRIMAAPAIPTVEDLLGMTGQGGALDDLITLVENDGDCRPILDAYSANGETLSDLYWFLMRAGAGQMIGEKYAPCFALADPLVLEYLLSNQMADRLGPETAANVVAFYRTGNKGLLPLRNRPGATAAHPADHRPIEAHVKAGKARHGGNDHGRQRASILVGSPTNVEKFIANAASAPYKELIQHHMTRQSAEQLRNGAAGETEMLARYDIDVDPHVFTETFLDHLNGMAFNRAEQSPLWSMNCRDAFDFIRTSAASHAGGKLAEILNRFRLESKTTNEQLLAHEVTFSVFQIATLNFAYNASLSEDVQKFIGIGRWRTFFRRMRRWVMGAVLVLAFFGSLEHPVGLRSLAHSFGIVLLIASIGMGWTRGWQEFGPEWWKLALKVGAGALCGLFLLNL